MKNLIMNTEGDPGKTGKFSLAKFTGVFIGAMIIPLALSFFGILLPALPVPLTVTGWIMATFSMGVMGAGFYHGLGKGIFKDLAAAYVAKAGK